MAQVSLRAVIRVPQYLSFSCQSSFALQASPCPISSVRAFSTTRICSRRTRDHNKNRGVSFLRATGFRKRQPQLYGGPPENRKFLPKPVLDMAQHEKPEVDQDHGLWEFFSKKRTSMTFAQDEQLIGRHWSMPELRNKSWEELHKLWWVCFKDRSRVATSMKERERLEVTHGQGDFSGRMDMLKQTQKHIRRVLTERWYAWEDARKIAASDPSIDLTGESAGGAYNEELDTTSPLFDNDSRPYSESLDSSRI